MSWKDKIKETVKVKQILPFLWRVVKGNILRLVLLLVLGTVDVVLSLSVIAVSKQVIDIASGAQAGHLMQMIAVLASMFVVSIALRSWYTLLNIKMSLSMENRLTQHCYRSVMWTEWKHLQTYHSGDIMARMNRDVNDVTRLWTGTIPQFFLTFLKLCGAFIFLYRMEPDLALVLAGLVPVVLLLSKMYFKRMRSLSRDIKETWSGIRTYFQETIQNAEVMKAFRMEGHGSSRLGGRQDHYVDATMHYTNFSLTSRIVLSLGFMSGYMVTFTWGLFRLQDGLITFGTMMAFLQLVNMIQGPALGLVGLVPEMISTFTAAERLLELDALPKEKIEQQELMPDLERIDFKNVSFAYRDDRPVLKHLNLSFEAGKVYAIAGATGCGKTTVIRLLLGFISPEEGKVELSEHGRRIAISGETRINFSYVPQDNALFSGTIRDNLRVMRPAASDEELFTALDEAAAGFVREMPEGLDTVLKEQGKGLSGGQIQRLAVARALLGPGKVLLLDEVTSSLDGETEYEIISSLRQIAHKRLIILVSHKQRVIDSCDKVYRLDEN